MAHKLHVYPVHAHYLKLRDPWWHMVRSGEKLWETRSEADRTFHAGDLLVFEHYDAQGVPYAGAVWIIRRVTRVLRDVPGLKPGWVLMMMEVVNNDGEHDDRRGSGNGAFGTPGDGGPFDQQPDAVRGNVGPRSERAVQPAEAGHELPGDGREMVDEQRRAAEPGGAPQDGEGRGEAVEEEHPLSPEDQVTIVPGADRLFGLPVVTDPSLDNVEPPTFGAPLLDTDPVLDAILEIQECVVGLQRIIRQIDSQGRRLAQARVEQLRSE